jgi:predicted component of type VI protein secretion system
MPYVEFEARVRSLGPGVLTIGNAPEAGWRIIGRGLEPLHAILSLEPGGKARIVRGSGGAVISVNGVELPDGKGFLQFGDVIRMSTAEFRYRQYQAASGQHAYIRDTRRNRVYAIGEKTSIGRDVGSTIVLGEPSVSRHHAEVVREKDSYVVRPQAAAVVSVNGSRVVDDALLLEGDEIAIGGTVLKFTTHLPAGSAVSAEPVRVSPAAAAAARASRAHAQTTFLGPIEIRDRESRETRRKLTRGIAVACTVVAVVGVFVLMYSGARENGGRHRRLRHVPPPPSHDSVAQ